MVSGLEIVGVLLFFLLGTFTFSQKAINILDVVVLIDVTIKIIVL